MRYINLVMAGVMTVSASVGARAQESRGMAVDSAPQWTVGATQFRGGSMDLGLERLNADLSRNGRPTFSSSIPSVGVSTYARHGRMLVGASVEGTLSRRGVQDGWVTKLSASAATLDAGMALIDASRFFVYSMASLGLRSTSLHFEHRGDFTYDDGLGDPARGVDLSSRGGIAQLGVSAEWRFDTRIAGRFALAVQMGTTQPLGSPSTSAGENRVSQTPNPTSGRYIRIAFNKPLARRARAFDTAGAALLSMLAW